MKIDKLKNDQTIFKSSLEKGFALVYKAIYLL